MKKIVLLTDQIHKIGGIGSLIHLKANYWHVHKGHEVHIITTEQMGKPSFYKFNSEVKIHDLHVVYDRNSSYFKPPNLWLMLKNYFSLKKVLNRIGPDIVIVANHIPVTFFFPLLGIKAKFVKEFHFSKFYIHQRKKNFFKRFEKFIEKQYDYLVVLNSEELKFYESQNVVHIPNPIALDDNWEPCFENRKKVALSAGRISPVKRFDVLLDIWFKFAALNNDWCLEIYGGGEENDVQALQQKINELGLQKRVALKNSTNVLHEIMRTSGLYLMTSAQECFPMVLLEAQANGLPIIAFDCPTGPRNIITHGHDGILVPFDDQTKFVSELSKLTTYGEKRIELAKNGYISSKQYELRRVMDLWETQIIQSK